MSVREKLFEARHVAWNWKHKDPDHYTEIYHTPHRRARRDR